MSHSLCHHFIRLCNYYIIEGRKKKLSKFHLLPEFNLYLLQMYFQDVDPQQSSQQPQRLPSLVSLHPPQQFQYQEEKQVPTSLRRGPWSLEEDKKLMDAINIFGPSNWVRISQNLGTRTPKQCRERYHQNLKPSLNRNPITPEEGQLIEELVLKYGKRWAEIARHLNGRSDNAIKNWWNGGANRRRRASTQAILDAQLHPAPIQPLAPLTPLTDFKSPSFNTSMFSKEPNTPLRASSITQEMFQQHHGIKRLLDEQHNFPIRRHSTQTILTNNGSTSPFSNNYSRNDSSRNSSISFDFQSSSNSRRSSLAHELFLPTKKRQNSQSSSYLSPNFPSHRNSAISIPTGLTPLTSTIDGNLNNNINNDNLFKPDFNFNKNNNDQFFNNPDYKKEIKLDRDDDEPKTVMNISNLLS